MRKNFNVDIEDNGAVYLIVINKGTQDRCVAGYTHTLGEAWNHIVWMYRCENQEFTVGEKKIPVVDWLEGMFKAGYIDYEV